MGRGRIQVLVVACAVVLGALVSSYPASATDVEWPQTKMLHFMACAPGSTKYNKSDTNSQCYLHQFVAFPGSAPAGGSSPMVFCNTHDLGWEPSTVVISEATWAGAENVGVGAVTYLLRDATSGNVVRQATSPLALGLYPPLQGGHPFAIPFHVERSGSYVMSMEYSGGTAYIGHAHGGGPYHNVTVHWQPSKSQGVAVRIAECGDEPAVRRLAGKRPAIRASVSDCLLPEYKNLIRYEWVVFGGTGSERLTPAGDMSGCSITVPQTVGGKKVTRVEVTRSTFGGLRRTTRSVAVPGSSCALPTDFAEIDWATMPGSVQRGIRRAMLAEWRQQNPADTPQGSAEEFRRYAGLLDAVLALGPSYWRHPLSQNSQNVNLNAAWRAVRESPDELRNLPLYACLMMDNLGRAAASGDVGFERSALALLEGVLSGAVDTAKAGLSLAALMTYERPLSLSESLGWWTQQNPGDVVEQARAAGIALSEGTAREFLDTVETINAAALRGDDKTVQEIIGKMGGRAVFDELFALGSVKMLAAGGKYVVTPLAKRVEKSLERVGQKFKRPVLQVYKMRAAEISVREGLELGYDDFTIQHYTAICEEYGVMCGFASNDAVGGAKVANGELLPKPEGLAAANSITPDDIALGIDPARRGEVYFGPVDPPGPGASRAVVDRYNKRAAAYNVTNPDGSPNPVAIRNHEIIDWLKQDPATRGGPPAGLRDAYGSRYEYGRMADLHIRVEDGIIRDVATGKGFGPDSDPIVMKLAATGEMAPPELVDEVTARLFPAGIQHGFAAHTRLISDSKRRVILEAAGGLGERPMIYFGGRGVDALPVRGFVTVRESDAWLLAHPDYVGR